MTTLVAVNKLFAAVYRVIRLHTSSASTALSLQALGEHLLKSGSGKKVLLPSSAPDPAVPYTALPAPSG